MLKLLRHLKKIKSVENSVMEIVHDAYAKSDRTGNLEIRKNIDRFAHFMILENKGIPLIIRHIYVSIAFIVFFVAGIIIIFLKHNGNFGIVEILFAVNMSVLFISIVDYFAIRGYEKYKKILTESMKNMFGENVPLDKNNNYDCIQDMIAVKDFVFKD